jgi:hypothetical protein
MKHILVVMILVASLAFTFQSVSAADVTGAVDFNSAYVWRGMTLNDGFVLQPSVDIAKGGFDLNVWGNFDMDDYDDTLDSGEFSEVDVTASYGFKFKMVDLRFGYIEYLFPTTDAGGAPGTREIFASAGMDLPAGFGVSLDVYRDIDELKEWYTSLGLAYSYAVNEKLSLGAGAAIAWAGDDYCSDGSGGFYDYNLSISAGYLLTPEWSVTGFIKYTNALDSDNLADKDDGGSLDVKTYGGVGVTYTF